MASAILAFSVEYCDRNARPGVVAVGLNGKAERKVQPTIPQALLIDLLS
jgi:hypothetical protein